MNVLFILNTTTVCNGATKAFYQLVLELKKKNVNTFVVCPNQNGIYKDLVTQGIQTFQVQMRNHTYPPTKSIKDIGLFFIRICYYAYINKKAISKLLEICNSIHPDIIHSNGSLINIGENTAEKLSIHHIYHIREYQDLDFGYKMMPNKKAFIASFSQPNKWAICITKGVQEHFNLSDKNSVVIYDGVKHRNEIRQLKNKSNYFLFAGRLTSGKGIDDALTSFSEFHKDFQHYEFWIAGMAMESSYQTYLEELCKKLNIENSVKFLGPRNDIDELMTNSKAVIMASRFEGFGLVTAEAMFNGTLVIGRNTGGTKEQFQNGKNYTSENIGLPFNTVPELTSQMKVAATMDVQKYTHIIEISQEVVSSLYSIENHADKVYKFYCHILKTNATNSCHLPI